MDLAITTKQIIRFVGSTARFAGIECQRQLYAALWTADVPNEAHASIDPDNV